MELQAAACVDVRSIPPGSEIYSGKKKKKALHTAYFTPCFIFDVFACAIRTVSTYQVSPLCSVTCLRHFKVVPRCELDRGKKGGKAQPDSPGSGDCWLLKIPLCRDVLSQRRIPSAGKSDIFTWSIFFLSFSPSCLCSIQPEQVALL